MSDEHDIQTDDSQVATDAGDGEMESARDQAAEMSNEIDLGRVRELVLAAHPDVVPEMIAGESFEELMASVEPAREAYQRIFSQAAERSDAGRGAPRVAAQPGGRGAEVIDMDGLSPLGKISEGLRRV